MSVDPSGFDFFSPPAGSVAPSPAARPGSSPTSGAPVPAASLQASVPPRAGMPSHLAPKTSRWTKSDTTFGPVGRIVTTIMLALPMLFFVATGLLTFDPFVFIGAVIWGFLAVTGMRHVWAPVKRN